MILVFYDASKDKIFEYVPDFISSKEYYKNGSMKKMKIQIGLSIDTDDLFLLGPLNYKNPEREGV